MRKETKNLILINLGIFFLFLIDRLSKWLARHFLGQGESFVYLKFFRLELYLNKGIAFSVPFSAPLLFFINGLILLSLFTFLVGAYRKKNLFAIGGLTLIVVGALSNLLDRISHEAVVDFINLRVLPIFNLADIMIITGVVILIFKGFSPAHEKIQQKKRGF